MLSRIGKFYHFTNNKVVDKYDEVYHDMLWYLMHETKVNRIVSRESIREFLTRFFLIANIDLDRVAEDFIDHGILLEGTIGGESFIFKMQDLLAFMGFSCSDFPYNFHGTLDEFKKNYVHRALNPSVKLSEDEQSVNINADTLMIGFLGLETLAEIKSLSIRFRNSLFELPADHVERASKLTEYITSLIPLSVFSELNERYSEQIKQFKECFDRSSIIKVDVFSVFSREELFSIYEHIIHPETMNKYRNASFSDPDVIEDLSYYNTHILFAYGVKHGYINKNYEVYDNHLSYDPLFDIDIDCLAGPDGEVYSTMDIYNDWSMEEWIHLIP